MRVAELLEDLADLVVHRVKEGHPLAVRRQAFPASLQRVGVPVDADDMGLRAPGEHCLGVPTEAERGIHEQGSLPVGLQQIGPQFSENTLFRTGHPLEAALGFDTVPERLRG